MTLDPAVRDAHLRRANEVRLRRLAVKRAVAAGERGADDVLTSGDPLLAGMALNDLLLAVPGVGKSVARRLREPYQLSETITLGALSPVTVGRLLVDLRQHRANPNAARAQIGYRPGRPRKVTA